MRIAILSAAAAFCLLAAVPAAAAATGPQSRSEAVVVPSGGIDARVILVRQGCGYGFHRDARGRCRPNYAPPPPPRRYYRHYHGRRCVTRLTPYGMRRYCYYY